MVQVYLKPSSSNCSILSDGVFSRVPAKQTGSDPHLEQVLLLELAGLRTHIHDGRVSRHTPFEASDLAADR